MGEGGTAVPRPLSAGVTLKRLVVQTVDENWTPTYVQETSSGDNRSERRFDFGPGSRGEGGREEGPSACRRKKNIPDNRKTSE